MVYANAPHRAYYWIALATAGLTAFYMMRLFVIAFTGESRCPHPESIHESPPAMTWPLAVLAVLAILGGLIGVPHVLGHNYFAAWLDFLGQRTPHHIAGSRLQETHLMTISALWGGACLLLSWWTFTRGAAAAESLKRRCIGVYQLLADKFRVDELYDAVIVKPVRVVSEKFLNGVMDRLFIDGLLVHGFADAARFLSGAVTSVQTGLIAHYVVYLVLGVCFVLAFTVL
jgi:NADH-quinone oxidoreductase subunit L